MTKFLNFMAYPMILVFTLGETVRRGVGYFSVNATTMLEDYLCAAVFILAVGAYHLKSKMAPKFAIMAWAWSAGGMFVPFAAHFEAFLRGETFRPDHPITDVNSIILKGVIWGVSVLGLIIALRNEASSVKAAQVCKATA